MKKTMYFLLIFLGVVLVSLATTMAYHLIVQPEQKIEVADSIAPIQGALYTAEDVYVDHQFLMEERYTDSVYLSIPDDVLMNIAKVCLGRTGYIYRGDIVQEYIKNYETIYQHLSKQTEPDKEPEALKPETPPAQVSKIDSTLIKDTVINGEPLKIISR